MKNKLICPICKGHAILFTLPNNTYVIRCTDCKISSMQSKDKDYLVFCWESIPV